MQNEVVIVRCIEMGWYTVENNATIRQTAEAFQVSCSSVYYELTKNLPKAFPQLAAEVQKVFDENKKHRSHRGGIATKRKYIAMKAK